MRRALKTIVFGLIALLLAPSSVSAAAHLKFSAPPASVCQGSTFTLQLLMDSPDEGINAAQVDLTFDPAVARIDSMNWLTSMFRFFAEGPEWDNTAGTIHIVGGLPTPGFQGMNGLVAELTMTTNGLGNADLVYHEATTDVLLDDGHGTSTTVTFDNAIIEVFPSTHPACSPPVTCTDRTIFEGGTANLTAAGGDGSYTWTTGGVPSFGSGSALSVTYDTAGTYSVTVADGAGKIGNCSVTVNVPPFGCSPGSRSIAPGGTASFSAVGGTGPYTWTTTGGSPTDGTGNSFSSTYPSLGSFVVTMTDALGASDTCNVNVGLPTTPTPIPTPTPCPVCPGLAPPPPPIEVGTTETEVREILTTVFSDQATEVVVRTVYMNSEWLELIATVAAVGLALTTALGFLQLATATGGILQAGSMLIRGLLVPVVPDPRKRRLWGTVYDSFTKSPLADVRLELLSKDNRVLETRFTDRDGRYGFVLSTESIETKVREVQIRASKKEYRFPSTVKVDEHESMVYQNIYRGGVVQVKEDQLVSHDIPLDSEQPQAFKQKKVPLSALLSRWIASFADASFKVGLVVAPLNFIMHPSIFDGVVVGIYGILGIARLLGANFRPYGLVVDVSSNNAVPYSFITLADASGTRVGHAVSDDRGRYFLLAQEGSFIIEAHTPAQIQPGRSLRKVVSAKKGWVSRKLKL